MPCIALRIASSPSTYFGVLSARTGTGCDLNIHAGCPLNMHLHICQPLLISSQPMPPICAASGLMCAVLSRDRVQTSSQVFIICLQWHVTPRALEQWRKYKTMIHEDAAKKQQPAQHSRQDSSREKSATPAAPQAPTAHQIGAMHPPDMMQIAAALAKQSSTSPPKTKRRRLSPDMQQDRQPQHPQQQQQQQQVVAQSGIGVHQQPCNLADEHASHLNDTVGAVYVDAAGQTLLPRLCQPLLACKQISHVDLTSACGHLIIRSRRMGILSQLLHVLTPCWCGLLIPQSY